MTTEQLLQAILDNREPYGLARLAKFHESAMQTAATAALIIRPTTTSAITIWNGENVGGKFLVLDRFFSFNLVTDTAQSFASLWYCMHLEMDKPTNDIITLRGTGDGREPNNGTVIVDVAATVVNDGWFPCGKPSEGEEVGALPGGVLEWEVRGRLVVPPKHGISLQVVSGVVGDTFTSGASWWRTQLPS